MPCINLIGEMAKRKVSIEDISFSIEQSFQIQETYFPNLELKYLFLTEEKGE